MENQVVVVVFDARLRTQELCDKIEELRKMPGVVSVKTSESVMNFLLEPSPTEVRA